MKKLVLLTLSASFLFSSCLRRNYTCVCTDSSGNSITETGWYSGNDANGYIINVETNLEDELNAACNCTYN